MEAYSCAEVEKPLGALKQEKAELTDKLVEAGLKTAERQAEDQCQ